MSVKELKTVIQLRRDTAANWASIEESFVPKKGEVCFVDTTDKGLRAKVGDGSTILKNLSFIDDNLYEEVETVVVQGYYLNGKFYTDSTYTVEMEKRLNRIYIDKNSKTIFHYDGSSYISVNDSLPTASDVVAGITKLYQASGQNTDGAMSQKIVTNGVKDITFALDDDEEECLKLNLPW